MSLHESIIDESFPQSEIILYQTEDGGTRLQVRLEGETVWLSLNQMADLFQRDKSVISRHIKNVFEDGELSRKATVAKSATVQTEGDKQVTRDIEFYNLDVIISVGYRVKSLRGTQFRIWATQRLRKTIVKGFAMDDERLKQSGAVCISTSCWRRCFGAAYGALASVGELCSKATALKIQRLAG